MTWKLQIRAICPAPTIPVRSVAAGQSTLSEAEIDQVSGGGGARGGIIEKDGP